MTEEKTPTRRGRPPRLPRSSGVAGSEATATPEVFEPRRGRKSAAAVPEAPTVPTPMWRSSCRGSQSAPVVPRNTGVSSTRPLIRMLAFSPGSP